jgi:hypothetical protein
MVCGLSISTIICPSGPVTKIIQNLYSGVRGRVSGVRIQVSGLGVGGTVQRVLPVRP